VHGVVLAGALAPPELQARGIERIPALRIQGETLLARACRCLREGGECAGVSVLAPAALDLPEQPGVARAAYSGRVMSDLFACLTEQASVEYILLAASDLPLLTSEAVAAVKAAGLARGADVVYPVADRKLVEQRFPGTKRTYLRVGTTAVTGGNVFCIRREWLLARRELLQALFAKRKSVTGLARIFGLWFLLRVITGLTSFEYLERHLGHIVQGKLHAAVLPFPELTVDLDKEADLELFAPYLDPWAVEA